MYLTEYNLKLNIWLWFKLDLFKTKSVSGLMTDIEFCAQNIKASLKENQTLENIALSVLVLQVTRLFQACMNSGSRTLLYAGPEVAFASP